MPVTGCIAMRLAAAASLGMGLLAATGASLGLGLAATGASLGLGLAAIGASLGIGLAATSASFGLGFAAMASRGSVAEELLQVADLVTIHRFNAESVNKKLYKFEVKRYVLQGPEMEEEGNARTANDLMKVAVWRCWKVKAPRHTPPVCAL